MTNDASKDQNDVSTLLGVSNADGSTPVKIWASPSTHRLLVDTSGGGGTPGSPTNSIQYNNAGAFGGSSTLLFNGTDSITSGSEGTTFNILGATATTNATNGGGLFIAGGQGKTSGGGGGVELLGGSGGTSGAGGTASLVGGIGGSSSGAGGDIFITAGSPQAGNSNGGRIIMDPGSQSGAGTKGVVEIADPLSTRAAIFNTDSLTADRTFAFPDASGTFQLSGGSGTGQFADNETPSGTINSSNAVFTLAHTPAPAGSLQLFLNGALQQAGGGDYSLSTATITFNSAPLTGSVLICWYRY